MGDWQGLAAPPSSEHVNEVVSSEAAKPTAALAEATAATGGAGGATVSAGPGALGMRGFGGVVSADSVLLKPLRGPSSATSRELPVPGSLKELCDGQPSPATPQTTSLSVKPMARPPAVSAPSPPKQSPTMPVVSQAEPPAPPVLPMNW